MTRVEALRDSKAAISLTPMVPTGQKSEPSEFWETLLQLNPDSDEGYAPDENQLRVRCRLHCLPNQFHRRCKALPRV